MGTLVAWHYPTNLFAGQADHTYVACGNGGKAWNCWGGLGQIGRHRLALDLRLVHSGLPQLHLRRWQAAFRQVSRHVLVLVEGSLVARSPALPFDREPYSSSRSVR